MSLLNDTGLLQTKNKEQLIFLATSQKIEPSTITLVIALKLLNKGVPIFYFSRASDRTAFTEKLFSIDSQVSLKKIKNGDLDSTAWKQLGETLETYKEKNLFISNEKCSIAQIGQNIKQQLAQMKTLKTPLLIIDSPHLPNKILPEIKKLSQKNKIHTLLSTQFAGTGKLKNGTLSLQDSKKIVQENMDLITQVWFFYHEEQKKFTQATAKVFNIENSKSWPVSNKTNTYPVELPTSLNQRPSG